MGDLLLDSFAQRVDALLSTVAAGYVSQRLRVTTESPGLRLLHVEDYQLGVLLSSSAPGARTLSSEMLAQAEDLLLASPNAVALVIVWDEETLPALALRLVRLRELRHSPQGAVRLAARARPLDVTLRGVIDRQVRTWQLPAPGSATGKPPAPDLAAVFADNLERTMAAERQRRFVIPERTIAAGQLDSSDARLILQTLKLTLAGANAGHVTEKLIRIE